MKERPILFSAPMVRAILAGTKTQTRRVVKPQPPAGTEQVSAWHHPEDDERGQRFWSWSHDADRPHGSFIDGLWHQHCPYGQPGDRLLVRETHYAWGHWTKRINKAKGREAWHFVDETIGAGKSYRYDADEKLPRRKRELHEVGWWKRPAIFMPRAASRITLEITGVRVERLQAISIDDAKAEGAWPDVSVVGDCAAYFGIDVLAVNPRRAFQMLWERINGTDSWAANPWVWAVDFKRVGAP